MKNRMLLIAGIAILATAAQAQTVSTIADLHATGVGRILGTSSSNAVPTPAALAPLAIAIGQIGRKVFRKR